MPFVVDAPVAAAWFLPDERGGPAERLVERLRVDTPFAPAIAWFEIRNMLLVNERRGRIARAETSDALAALEALPIVLDHEPRSAEVVRLAWRHRLTAYDAAYLELALRRCLPLATRNERLVAAASSEGVEPLAPG